MSGGRWRYQQHNVRDCLDDVTKDPMAIERWPKSIRILKALNDELSDILHDMDWDLSDDSYVDDDFDEKSVIRLINAIVPDTESVIKSMETNLKLLHEIMKVIEDRAEASSDEATEYYNKVIEKNK